MIGKRLKQARKQAGYSQKQLSNLLGVCVNTISFYEREVTTPNDDTKVAISKLLHVSIDYLLGVNDIFPPIALTTESIVKEPPRKSAS